MYTGLYSVSTRNLYSTVGTLATYGFDAIRILWGHHWDRFSQGPWPRKVAFTNEGCLGEVLMAVSVVDSLRWIADGQALAGRLTISMIAGTTVGGEVGGLVDERSGLGIGTSVRGVPEGTAQVDLSELVGI